MKYDVIHFKAAKSGADASLYTYFLDNTEEIDRNRTRPVILLCPGGGYAKTSDREGEAVAMQFLAAGFHAAVLKYSVCPERYPAALRQVAWSVSYLRENAEAYHINKNQIIVMGFSAGGHLAASYGVFWKNHTFLADELGVSSETLRPNGLILAYPVISSGKWAHKESFLNLLGGRYEELAEEMSLENQVNEDTPPAFIWHTQKDAHVPVENSLLFFQALHARHIPAELHIYPVGGHGLSLANEETRASDGKGVSEACQGWIHLAVRWVKHTLAGEAQSGK